MKRFILLTMLLVSNIMLMFAENRNDTIIYMTNHPSEVVVCLNRFSGVEIYGPECENYTWTVRLNGGPNQHPQGNPITIEGVYGDCYSIAYNGCGFSWNFNICFNDDRSVPNSFTHDEWMHTGDTLMLHAVQNVGDSIYYNFHWSTGEGGFAVWEIPVLQRGTYICTIPAMCGTAVRTFNVEESVEIHRAGVDLETGLNKPTWHYNPELADVYDQVKVIRDGFVVGTVPYEQGYFLDAIGSENAARTYQIVGILPNGTECPITSYGKGTPHVDYSENASNPNKLNMAWTPPYIQEGANVAISYFQICKYDPATGQVTVIDQIGPNNTIASYNKDLFDGGYAVLGVVFNDGRDNEDVSFSNRSEDIIEAVGEQSGRDLRIYPNPAKGRVTIEGKGMAIITNALGQTILTQEIDGKATIELPQGIYFVKLGGTTRKIVME